MTTPPSEFDIARAVDFTDAWNARLSKKYTPAQVEILNILLTLTTMSMSIIKHGDQLLLSQLQHVISQLNRMSGLPFDDIKAELADILTLFLK